MTGGIWNPDLERCCCPPPPNDEGCGRYCQEQDDPYTGVILLQFQQNAVDTDQGPWCVTGSRDEYPLIAGDPDEIENSSTVYELTHNPAWDYQRSTYGWDCWHYVDGELSTPITPATDDVTFTHWRIAVVQIFHDSAAFAPDYYGGVMVYSGAPPADTPHIFNAACNQAGGLQVKPFAYVRVASPPNVWPLWVNAQYDSGNTSDSDAVLRSCPPTTGDAVVTTCTSHWPSSEQFLCAGFDWCINNYYRRLVHFEGNFAWGTSSEPSNVCRTGLQAGVEMTVLAEDERWFFGNPGGGANLVKIWSP